MMISFDNETSRPATGTHQPVGSHMREWGHSPRNYKTQCSAAFKPSFDTLPEDRDFAAWIFIFLFGMGPFVISGVCYGIIRLLS